MKKIILMTSVSLALALPTVGTASDADTAESLCKLKIMAKHGADGDWKHVDHESLGDGKYRVTGKRKQDGDMYEFSCKVKDNFVTSYDYDEANDEDELSDEQKAAAAAVIIAAAAVAAQNQDDDDDEYEGKKLLDKLEGKEWSDAHDILRNKGFEKAKKNIKTPDAKLTYWWQEKNERCISVVVEDHEVTRATELNHVVCGE